MVMGLTGNQEQEGKKLSVPCLLLLSYDSPAIILLLHTNDIQV